MNYFKRIEQWGDNHHPKWLDIIRIMLGIFLCYKAIAFLMNMSNLVSLMGKSNMGFNSFVLMLLGQFIVIVTLMCGILLILGLHTRLVCLIQIPILIGAIILLNSSGISAPANEIMLSVITLILLLSFLVIGNGPWSFSNFFIEEKDKTIREV
jgi:uncharacterized membrane protein YphA (DoxX/SURF4 family)